MKPSIPLIIVLAALAAMPAAARDPAWARPAFDVLDADGDGQVTRAELDAYRAALADRRFAAADADGSGTLDAAEILSAREARADARRDARAARLIERLDTDGDAAVSRAELAGAADGRRGGRALDRADTDGNGTLSRAEWEAFEPRDRGPGRDHGRRGG
ncbi:MAG: EF-hand domain-containing protein [Hasllibacter sp.]